MRARIAATLVILLVAAGCVGSSESAEVDASGDEQASLPAPIHDERSVEASANPLAAADREQGCASDAATCVSYPFQVREDARVQANLDWSEQTNDFDMHIVGPEGEQVASSSTGPLATSERLDAELAPGSYELVVVAWIAAEDTYALEAHFGYA
jgi:hypothetical protein